MKNEIDQLRQHVIEQVLAKQDDAGRWGHDPKLARERPEYIYYSPNYKSTLWTLVLLADIQAPAALGPAKAALRLVTERFFDPEHSIFGLPGGIRFPIPCLNGNMIYLHQYFGNGAAGTLETTFDFFATHQRFDDGGFKTPKVFPYCSNIYCYGKHTCYWGITKLFKGLSFIPLAERSKNTQRLLENCVEFILQHDVCFSSHKKEALLHRDIGLLTFPNFYKSDFLEILWLLAREGIRDPRIHRALQLLKSRMQEGGFWVLERSMNTIIPVGQKDSPNPFITERARAVVDFWGNFN